MLLAAALCVSTSLGLEVSTEAMQGGVWKASFDVTVSPGQTGTIVIEVHPEWAPRGAARFKELIDQKFFDNARFFRVISGFMVQFGLPADPRVAARWQNANLVDDPVAVSNKRGYITYAMAGPNTRTTQMFINFGDNSNLDSQGFSPFGMVVQGMDVVDRLYNVYGEGAPSGNGPDQGRIQSEGNNYLIRQFPSLSYINTCTLASPAADPSLRQAARNGATQQPANSFQALPGYKTTFEIVRPGQPGRKVNPGDRVTVHATGTVMETGKKFWSTHDPGQQAFSYGAGQGQVITGWDQGCIGMTVGEVRDLVIPASEGYGAQGFPAWGIPAGGTLLFEIEVMTIA